jgi:4-hydroxybenzoate polyprenyltransferase
MMARRESSPRVDGRRHRMSRWRDLAELVRAPAALTVPGDTLAGAAAAGWPLRARTVALPLASTCLYWAGMALNDYADREIDARERPERPIPSGRVRPRDALALAAGLTGAGVAVAALAGGRPALRVAVPLAATVWTYDLLASRTPLGPVAMAAARGLDVLLGSGGRPGDAALPTAAMAAHTLGLTVLSRGEVHGGSARTAGAVLAGTFATAGLAAVPARGTDVRAAATAAGLAATYAATVGAAQTAAVRRPDAGTIRRATGVGIRGMIPLQAALVARAGHVRMAVALLGAGPLARVASKAVSPT